MELANNLDCQARAREDIDRAVKVHGFTYEAFKDMKYLDQCIAEGVRLNPPVSTIDRYTRNDYKVSFWSVEILVRVLNQSEIVRI